MREYSPVYFWALDNPYEQHLFPPALVALLTIDTVEDHFLCQMNHMK